MVTDAGSRDKWPTTRVDLIDENSKEENHIVQTASVLLESKNNTYGKYDPKKRRQSSFQYQADAMDERMYATYLTQKVVFTRNGYFDLLKRC